MPAKARVKWTRASLRRALEDERTFDVARRCCNDDVTDKQIRRRIAWLLTWQRLRPGEPHLCRRCGKPTNEATGEVVVQGRFDGLWYRAVCLDCASARSQRTDAGPPPERRA
jgi:hypothetical protein